MNDNILYRKGYFCLFKELKLFLIIKFVLQKLFMMKKLKLLILSLILILINSCKPDENIFESFSGFTQGTTYSIIYENSTGIPPKDLMREVEELLHVFDMSLSTYNPGSIISKVNNNEEVEPDSLLYKVLYKAREVWEMTDVAFDITAGPLINAWGFGPDAIKKFDESMLDSLMKLVGMEKISIEGGRIVKEYPGMFLDVNAIAQGYSVDIVCSFLDSKQINNYLVEIGGEVRTKGTKNNQVPWKIGVDKPYDNIIPGSDLQTTIKLTNKALATSGNYRKFYEEDGIKYSHTIDPTTGYPVRHTLLSVTIITDDCMSADAFATACLASGLEKSITMLKKYEFLDAYLVYSDESGNLKTWFTDGMIEFISD